MPAISVIIPIYNTGDLLKLCLDSVCGQSLRDIEIILVDDGSKDNSYEVASKYAEIDPRIVLIKQDNAGAAIARKNAFIHSNGDYIMFVDSDDTIDEYMVEKLYNRCVNDKSQVCICGYNTISGNHIIPHFLPYKSNILEKLEIVEECIKPMIGFDAHSAIDFLPGFSCNKLFNRAILTTSMFVSDREFFAEDMILQLYALNKAQRVSVINDPLYNYIVNKNSLTTGYRKNGNVLRLNTYEKVKHICIGRNYHNIDIRLNNHLNGTICYCLLNAIRGSKSFKQFLLHYKEISNLKEFELFKRQFKGSNATRQYRIIYYFVRFYSPFLMYIYFKLRMNNL